VSPLHIFLVYPHTTIEELPQDALFRERSITITNLGENVYDIKLRNRKRAALGWLVTTKEVWIFYIMSEESSSIVGSVAEDWIRGMSPFLSPLRIPPSDLYDILDDLQKRAKGHLVLVDFLARFYKIGGRRDRENQKDWASHKGWPGEEYSRIVLEERLEGSLSTLHSVKIDFPNDKTSFSGRISRNGHLTYYTGNKEQGLSNFYLLVVEAYIQKALRYRNTLQNKGIKILREKNLIFPQVFNSKNPLGVKDFEKMIDAATTEPDYLVSVIHKGNPWMCLTIVDRNDGNTCEIFGFENRIEVVPQIKATPEGLARIEDMIYEVFPLLKKARK
jgi:hypothetical protein